MSWWWLAPCALAIVAVPFVWRPLWQIAGSLTQSASTATPSLPASRLGFSATHEGNDWRLVWSREALARLEAIGAMLTIRDGGVDRLQFLSPQDLAAGAILYVPKTSDLVFNLKVSLAGGPEIEEQVRVLGQDETQAADLLYTPPVRRLGESSRTYEPAPETAAPAPKPIVSTRQFQPPPARTTQTAPAGDAPLPEVSLPKAAAPPLRFAGTAPPLPPAPKTGEPAARPTPQTLTPITRIDPAPLRTVVASWPRSMPRQSRVDVQIRVKIDALGRVVGASPVERTVANFQFVDSAISAARMWTFSPATENGRPIPSESVLTFKFMP